jgi:hypothetical protein
MKGRRVELATLLAVIEATRPARIALVGSGGSGKSMLASAIGHRLAPRFPGGIFWFRLGAWDFRTLTEMLALRFGTVRERSKIEGGLRAFLRRSERLVVLDNHEDDAATARLLSTLNGTRATFVVTARRCLLGGVLVFPVTAPLVTSGKPAFPRVAALTRRLRWNPLALDIADAIVRSRGATTAGLAAFLDRNGIGEVSVIEHEDDLPEVRLLVAWAWPRISEAGRRMLGVLAHTEGDHVDLASLAKLARADRKAIAPLTRWHLVQQAMPGRYALHAVVRHALRKRTEPYPTAAFEHYVALLERDPSRITAEQSHVFAAMDHAHRTSNLDAMLRIDRLLARLNSDETS